MSLFTIAVIVVLVLAVIGLGWKTMLNGTITGFNTVLDRIPELKQLTNEAKQYLKSEAINDVFAHKESKGLRVFLTVNTNLVGQDVEIITSQFDEKVQTHNGYMNNGYTEFELKYAKGVIENGDFKVCVYARQGDVEECTYGYDSKEKEPEYLNINIFKSNLPESQPIDQSQAQSSSNENNNENNNALSQSQETTIYICKENGCTAQ